MPLRAGFRDVSVTEIKTGFTASLPQTVNENAATSSSFLLDVAAFSFTVCGKLAVNPVFISVTDTSRNPARSGIQAVVRGLVAGMAELRNDFWPVTWSAKRAAFTLLRPDRSRHLGSHHQPYENFLPVRWLLSSEYRRLFLHAAGRNYRVPIQDHPHYKRAVAGGWLLLPEV